MKKRTVKERNNEKGTTKMRQIPMYPSNNIDMNGYV